MNFTEHGVKQIKRFVNYGARSVLRKREYVTDRNVNIPVQPLHVRTEMLTFPRSKFQSPSTDTRLNQLQYAGARSSLLERNSAPSFRPRSSYLSLA